VLNTQTGEAVTSVTESAITQAFAGATPDDSGIKTVTVNIPAIADANAYVLEIPTKVLISGNSSDLIKVVTEIGTIILPTNMFAESEMPDEGSIELVISRADTSGLDEETKEKIGNRPVIEIYFRVNGVAIPWGNPYVHVNVSIPYSPSESEDREKITVWYIGGDGTIVPVYSGRYNSSTGTVTFTTTHFSKYAVAYVDITFEDISNYGWAKREIEVLASKGIVKGTSATRKIFNPSANITRADYAALLVRTLGLTAEVSSNFDDVATGDYFYEEVGIAKELGIVKGIGNNKFAPRAEITREEMMTMTARALKAINKLKTEGTAADLDKFADADQVASYAVESVAALVKDGLIVGSDNKLSPKEKAIRAEVAVLMYRIYNK
ncbi:MAG TPA: S-layer homology domain-containing protein, partial [Clostridiaceae bacterium]|nr:S-layer homology domain-containing protein [Clostridiaceae bacterium]